MDSFVAGVLLVGMIIAAVPPTIFAWRVRSRRLAVLVLGIGIAAPVLFMVWLPVGIGGDFYKQLGAFVVGLPVLAAATCIFLCVIVWAAWRVSKKNLEPGEEA